VEEGGDEVVEVAAVDVIGPDLVEVEVVIVVVLVHSDPGHEYASIAWSNARAISPVRFFTVGRYRD
jgi:hypothetical protein